MPIEQNIFSCSIPLVQYPCFTITLVHSTKWDLKIETTPVRKEVRIQFLQDTKQTVTIKLS